MKLDQNQLIDGFLAFIENFGKSVGMPVYLEYFPDSKNTAMCVKRNADTIVREAYIGGGYKADVTFSVLVQLSRRDKKNLLDVSRVLYALEAYMQTEEANGFPALKFDEKTKPIGLDMTSVCKSQYKNAGFGQNKNVGFPTFLFCLFNHHQSLAEADLLICRKDH